MCFTASGRLLAKDDLMNMSKQKEYKVEIRNRRASFDYEFLETYVAGISLVSTEIKSIRMGKASLVDSFCYFVGNELFVKGMNVAQYFWGSWGQHEPTRDRKLLLTKRELRHLRQAVKEKGLTIVATKSGWAKDTKGRWWKLAYLKKA